MARTVSSVVVVFELVAYGDYGNCRVVFDFEQRYVARSSERNDQFPEEGTAAGLAAGEGRRLLRGDAGAQGDHGLLWKVQVAAVMGQLPFDGEVEQPFEIRLGISRRPDLECHLPFVAGRTRTASSLRCRPSSTTSAST